MVQSLKSSDSPVVESIKVCWACRGVIKEFNEPAVKKHILLCSQKKNLDDDENIEHFVCDKSDYVVFINLKRSLHQLASDEKFVFKLQSTLPKNLVNYLSDLIVSTCPGSNKKTQKSDTFIAALKHNLPSYTTVTDKICQTHLERFIPRTKEHSQEEIIEDEIPNCVENNNIDKLLSDNVETTIALEDSSECTVSNKTDSVVDCSEGDSEHELQLTRDSFKVANGDKIVYECKLCSRQTSSGQQMLMHQRSHNDGQSFECDTCKFSTIWRKEWNIHLHQKHKSNNFLCHICASEFKTRTALNQHIVSSHSDTNGTGPRHKLQCEHCDYVAREMASLKEHMRKHTGEKIGCPHEGCQFTTFYARSLNKHLSHKHSTEKTQCCYICGFQTRHASSLTKHITLVHKDFKPYKCAQCSFTALYPSEIVSHARSKHLKVKRFACPKCPFKTSYQLAIQKHVARHNMPDGFHCLVCGEVSSSKHKAKKHMEKVHGSSHFQILDPEETTVEKVNANDYKIIEMDESTIDLNTVVVLNDTQRSKRVKESSKKVKNTKGAEPDVLFELPANVQGVSIEPSIIPENIDGNVETVHVDKNLSFKLLNSRTANVEVKTECVDENLPFELPESLLQASGALANGANVSESLDQDTDIYTRARATSAEGNPMLSGTTADFDDNDNSLSSLFDLMSDFPRPSMLNRCQSASTLMFASLSPHLIDRPLTPDFFTDSPSVASFFPNFSTKNLESDGLGLAAEGAFDSSVGQQTLSAPSVSNITSQQPQFRNPNSTFPVASSFLYSPQPGTERSLVEVHLSSSLEQESDCMEVDSVFSHLHTCQQDPSASSGFAALNQNFITEPIPMSQRATGIMEDDDTILQESPFPDRSHV